MDDDDVRNIHVLLSVIVASVAALIGMYNAITHEKTPSLFEQRLNWNEIVRKHGARQAFRRHLRMSTASFDKLLSYIKADLEVNERMASLRGGAILPEIKLYCTLRWLAGGSYSDIYMFAGNCRRQH